MPSEFRENRFQRFMRTRVYGWYYRAEDGTSNDLAAKVLIVLAGITLVAGTVFVVILQMVQGWVVMAVYLGVFFTNFYLFVFSKYYHTRWCAYERDRGE